MNYYLFAAGVLCILLGLVHSIFGEYLIFRDKRGKGKLVPTKISESLKGRHLRILWATWHLASVFGWCIGAVLIKISILANTINPEFTDFIVQSTIISMFISSFLVLIATNGKHPGWIILLIIGVLSILGIY